MQPIQVAIWRRVCALIRHLGIGKRFRDCFIIAAKQCCAVKCVTRYAHLIVWRRVAQPPCAVFLPHVVGCIFLKLILANHVAVHLRAVPLQHCARRALTSQRHRQQVPCVAVAVQPPLICDAQRLQQVVAAHVLCNVVAVYAAKWVCVDARALNAFKVSACWMRFRSHYVVVLAVYVLGPRQPVLCAAVLLVKICVQAPLLLYVLYNIVHCLVPSVGRA